MNKHRESGFRREQIVNITNVVLTVLLSLSMVIFLSCENVTNSGTTTVSTQPTIPTGGRGQQTTVVLTPTNSIDMSSFKTSVASVSSVTYNADDLIENTTFTHTITLNFSDSTVSLDSGTSQVITEAGILVTGDATAGVTVKLDTYGVTVNSTIDEAVIYELTGTLNGTFTIAESSKKYALILNGVTINGGSNGPAIDIESGKRFFVVLNNGTTNILSDTTSRADSMTQKATFYTKAQMVISGANTDGTGTGVLTVNSNYKNGIYSKDYIRIRGGSINVNCTAKDAIKTVNKFIMDDGQLTINATGTVQDDESKGIKVEGEDSDDGANLGYIVINGGTINITSVSKGITAGWDIDEDTDEAYPDTNPNPYVTINNGYITIKTTGTPYEGTDSSGNEISLSPEGIEGKTGITINSGYINVISTDDCLNVSQSNGKLEINGGYLYCYSTNNDAIDSNGTISINGGVVVARGTTTPECAFDCDQNPLTITGGTLVGIGTSNYSAPTTSSCTQNVVVASSSIASAGQTIVIKDSDQNTIFAYEVPSTYEVMIISSPTISSGKTYTTYTGGIMTGSDNFFGLYLNSFNSTGGTSGTSFTTSSTVTTVGTISNQGAQEGTPGVPPQR